MQRTLSGLLVASLVLPLAACSPVLSTCHYAEVLPQPHPRVSTARPESGECFRLLGGIPGEYVLEREAYTVRLSTGDRYYPRLWLAARDSADRRLLLAGPGVLPMRPEPLPGDADEGFDYFVRITERAGSGFSPDTLELSVRDSSGRVLGTERLPLRVRRARHFYWDTL